MLAFQRRNGTEATCEAAVLAERWPNCFACPHCEGTRCSRYERHGRTYWQCAACPRQYSPLAATVFDNTKLLLTEWITCRLHPDAEVFSDGLGAFRAACELDHAHTVMQANSPREGCEVEGARWVNSVMGNIKRFLDGTYHAFAFFKDAKLYLAEASWRFDRAALLPRLLVAALRCSAWSELKPRNVPVYTS